jgi:hypothetical protein
MKTYITNNKSPDVGLCSTRWTFNTRFKEYIYATKENKQNLKYAQYILKAGHKHSTTNETLEKLHTEMKGHLLNTLQIFHTYITSVIKNEWYICRYKESHIWLNF